MLNSHTKYQKTILNNNVLLARYSVGYFYGRPYRVAQIKIPHRTKCNFSTTCEIFIPKFLGLYGRHPATILKLKKKYFSFLQSYGYINILCDMFNSARNNQQQRVIFIHYSRQGFCVHLFRWERKIAFHSRQDQSEC